MLRKTGYLTAAAILAVYAFIAFRGPQGIPTLMQKQGEVRSLQEQNADLVRDIQALRNRINDLEQKRDAQELEIRERLKVLRPGERRFIVPDQPKPVPAEPLATPARR